MKKISIIVGIMMLLSMLGSLFLIGNVSATAIAVPGEHLTIQKAIDNSSDGDIITVGDGFYVEDININRGIILKSENGSATTWINGTVNITASNLTLGGESVGFTIYQAAIASTEVHAINVSTNGSSDNTRIDGCTIIGGYDGIHIGMGSGGGTANETSNITIYNCIIHGNGRSAIRAGPGQLVTANFSVVRAYNTSNTIYGDIICIDGGNNVLINDSFLYNSLTNGGMGFNSTGASNVLTNLRFDKNYIYDVDGYSPICIVSQSDANYVENVRITFNDLENNSKGTYSEAAIRFDNLSGKITATNISVFYNNINTTGNDIEEQFGLVATYKAWTGIMKAYFNWYGSDAAGSFRTAGHQYASPRLHAGTAVGDIWTGTDYLEGTLTAGSINATAQSDVIVSLITSTNDVVVVAYPYGLGGAYNPKGTSYPTRSMHNYKDVGVNDTSLITFPVNITMYYDAADLALRGWSETYINGLVFYNETSAEWEEFNSTGKNTSYSGGSYLGYVWGVAYEEAQLAGTVICINYNEIPADDGQGGTAPLETDTDNDGYSDADEIVAGSDPYDALSTPLTIAGATATISYLGIDWYYWVAIVTIIIGFIVVLYFALSPKAWKNFKKKF